MNLTLYNCQFYYRKATRVQTAGWVTEYRHNSSHVFRDTCHTCAALYSRAEQSPGKNRYKNPAGVKQGDNCVSYRQSQTYFWSHEAFSGVDHGETLVGVFYVVLILHLSHC